MNFFLVQVIIPELIFYCKLCVVNYFVKEQNSLSLVLILRFKKKKKIQNQNEKYVLILQRTETIITRILQFG
jgi:hypothetical protein